MRKLLDGKKRSAVLLAYMIAAIVQESGRGDYTGDIGSVRQLLDWNAQGRLALPLSVIVGTVAGSIAIYHAAAKSLRARAEKADTVSTRGLF